MALPMLNAFAAVHVAPALPLMFDYTMSNDEAADAVSEAYLETKEKLSTMARKTRESPKRLQCGSILSHLSEWMTKSQITEGQNFSWQAQKQVSAYMSRFNRCIACADSGSKKDYSKSTAMFNIHPQLRGNVGMEADWVGKLPAL